MNSDERDEPHPDRASGSFGGGSAERTTADQAWDRDAGRTDRYRPPVPPVTRLNRNVLTVLAVLGGITVITALVFLSPGRRSGAAGADRMALATAPGGARATFFDVPPRGAAGSPADAGVADTIGLPTPKLWPRRVSSGAGGHPERFGESPGSPTAGFRAARDTAAASEYAAALRSRDVVLRPAEDRGALSAASPAASWMRSAARPPSVPSPAFPADATAPASAGMLTMTGSGGGGSSDATDAASRHAAFLRSAAFDVPQSPAAPTNVSTPTSPYLLTAGTVIPAALVTAVVSDLPGAAVAQVTRDVYDAPTERWLLVPKGTRIIGRYEDRVAVGQDRLLVAWTRLILPDSRSLALPGPEAVNGSGAAGIGEHVDNHYARLFAHAALLSVLSAGFQLSQPQTTGFGAPSAAQVGTGAVGQQLTQASIDLLRRNGEIPPTISVSAGAPFAVLLTTDLAFTAPYVDTRAPTDSEPAP